MSNYQSDVNDMVARCRRIGWDVVTDDKGAAWSHRITPPDGRPIFLHRTPRDPVHAIANKWADLERQGFKAAEDVWLAAHKDDKANRLREERERADAEAAKVAKWAAARALAAGPLAGPQPFDPAWILTPAPRPDVKIGIMTPELAKKILDETNKRNRKPSPSRVAYFENLIRNDEFGATHQGAATDWNGILQDGQSRLQAIVNLDVPVEMQWNIGMDPAHFSRIDTGGPRNANQTADIMGEADPNVISTAAKILKMIDDFGPDAHIKARQGRVSNDAIAKAIIKYGTDLRNAVTFAKDIKKDVRKANAAGLACAIFLIRQRLPEGDMRVERFFEEIQDGNIEKTDVVWKLRQALMNGQNNRAYDMWSALALTIKAWNFRHTGKRPTVLVWKPHNEPFPCHVFLPPPPAVAGDVADHAEAA